MNATVRNNKPKAMPFLTIRSSEELNASPAAVLCESINQVGTTFHWKCLILLQDIESLTQTQQK